MAKRRRWSDEPRSRICNYVHPQAMYRNKFGSRCGPVSVTRWLSTRSHLFEHVLSSMSCLLFAQVSILSHVIVHVDRYVCVFFACVNSASHVMVHGHGVFNSVHASISAIIVWVMYLDCSVSHVMVHGHGVFSILPHVRVHVCSAPLSEEIIPRLWRPGFNLARTRNTNA